MDGNEANDYKLAFEDRQKVQRLRQKLIKASGLLKSSIDLGSRVLLFWDSIRAKKSSEVDQAVFRELEDYASEMWYYQRSVEDLLKRSSEAASMV